MKRKVFEYMSNYFDNPLNLLFGITKLPQHPTHYQFKFLVFSTLNTTTYAGGVVSCYWLLGYSGYLGD